MTASPAAKIVVTGAAGLVGQNLLPRLSGRNYDIVAIDKHPDNCAILRRLHPSVTVLECDMAVDQGWQSIVSDANTIVVGHAQIGGLNHDAFVANNLLATERLLEAAAARAPYLIHISSSVVNSTAQDWYTDTKRAQEELIVRSGLPSVVLRPTLMFGWFDRKHLGWLARFMKHMPVFPIPGDGRYLRQPLYAGDFCDIILSCIEQRPPEQAYNISGLERIAYIELMRAVKKACGARSRIVRLPYRLFWMLLSVYGAFDRNPPFTTKQLEALILPEIFEVIDWPGIFKVSPTPLQTAIDETFKHPIYSQIVLSF